MKYQKKIPWTQINDFLMEVGSERSVERFVHKAYEGINRLIPCDIATYSFGNNPKDYTVYKIYGIEGELREKFLNYYKRLLPPGVPISGLVNWNDYRHTEFVNDFMKPAGVGYSIGISLIDPPKNLVQIAVHRQPTGPSFDSLTVQIMELLSPHLQNIYT